MVDAPAAGTHTVDPRIAKARQVVLRIAWIVGGIFFVAAIFGGYYCATERPAREMFFEPEDPIGPR